MALITDPDLLSQGAPTTVADLVFGTPTGSTVTITSAGTSLPAMSAGAYFEVRGNANPNNNGLYVETGGTPSTGSITAKKLAGDGGAAPVAQGADSTIILHQEDSAGEQKSVYFDFYNRKIWLIKQGNLSVDGVTLQALYSFTKEEWKTDNTLIPHPFPFTAITPEQFEVTDDWVFEDSSISPGIFTTTRKLIRTGGWREVDQFDNIRQEYIGVISLGSFEDNINDNAYYQQGNDPTDTTAATFFTFAGPVNEAVRTYNYITDSNAGGIAITLNNTITRTTGSWTAEGYKTGGQISIVTSDTAGNVGDYVIDSAGTSSLRVVGTGLTNDADDANFTSAVNDRNVLNVFLRVRDSDVNGKTFAQSTLGDIGVTEVVNQVYRFPLTNATDLKISETDVTIAGSSPYNQIEVRYFDQAFTRDVDDPTGSNPRVFGIVIDVGTLSGVDGVSNGTTSFATAQGGIPATVYDGGTLTIHEGTDKGDHTISTASGTTVTLNSALTGSETNLSFTIQRSTPVVATAEEIYEKVQYQLRQDSDIDATGSGIVTGSTADGLLRFVGDTLEAGQAIPTNPNGGGSGVIIEGFDANDTNRLTFYDSAGLPRTFPFVAAGSIAFNNNLQNDADANFWMFFTYTTRTTNTDYAITAASGSNATFTSTGNLPTLTAGDYVAVSGFANPENNGVWRVTTFTSTSDIDMYKVDGENVINEAPGTAVNIDQNPINSPDAIIVNNNAGIPIAGSVSAQASVNFDFDYDNNTQGGRTSGTVAEVTIRAIGFDTAQFVETTGQITRAVGLTFSLVAALERNYANI